MNTLPNLKGNARKEAEEIIERTKELSKPDAKPEEKQKFIQELVKNFRYDGTTIASIQSEQLYGTEFSEQELSEAAQEDNSHFNLSLRKVAALAILTLTPKSLDGAWPREIAKREVNVPEYKQLVVTDTTAVEVKKGPFKFEQKLMVEELVQLLQQDLQAETDSNIRTEKVAALHENGLASGEQLGDLLISRVEGKHGSSCAERKRAIADLAELITRLRVEEGMRKYNQANSFAAKGLTAGLSSADLMKRLEIAAGEADDQEVKATALLCFILLKKEFLDNTDRDRVREFFLKEPPGLDYTELKKILEEDAASNPSDKGGWERKAIAAEILMRLSMSPEPSNIDKKYVELLQKCIAQKSQPEIAVRAIEALTRVASVGGSALAALEQACPDENWRRKLVIACLNNMDIPSGDVPPGMQLECARARIRFIETASALLQGNDDRLMKGQFAAKLLSRADQRIEPVEEVRAAAVIAIGASGIRAKTQVETLKRAVNAATEPSASVRLAAIDSIERLISGNKERREILAPLAVPEPDATVKERMTRYYDPTGSIRDRYSQRSRQEVEDTKREQNKLEFKPADIDKMVCVRFKTLAGSENIFEYLNAQEEVVKTIGAGEKQLSSLWDEAVSILDGGAFPDAAQKMAGLNLTTFELIAQNRAVRAYNRGVDDLAEAAMTQNKSTIKVGDKTVLEKDAAILALGSLVRNGSRMGAPFYQHRQTYDRTSSHPGLRRFGADEARHRQEVVRDSSEGLSIYEKDPWPATEMRIAEKLRDLCAKSSGNVNLSLLKDEILRALKSDSKTTDANRKILVDGLNLLLSNPKIGLESKREILTAVAEMVKLSREVQIDKSDALVSMIALLDKHGKSSFETYSDAYSAMRTAIVARAENDQMRPQLRLRAQEMFERQWISVLAERDRIPVQQGNARSRAEFLPKNTENLEKAKEASSDGFDEDVHDAVQRVITATKGCKLEADDLRRQALTDLTDEKFDDRVRLAALSALIESEIESDRELARQLLLEVAIGAKEKGIRQDAAKLLQDTQMECSENSIQAIYAEVIDKLAAASGKESRDLVGKQTTEILAEVNKYIADNLNSKAAREHAIAIELQAALHRYGEGLILIANLKPMLRTPPEEKERLYKLAFAAFGVEETDFNNMVAAARTNGDVHSAVGKTARELCNRIIQNLQHTGSIPSLLAGFNGYAKFCAERAVVEGKLKTDNVYIAIGLASISEAVSCVYYPPGSQGRIDEYQGIAEIYTELAARPLTASLRYHNRAANFMDLQAKELDAFNLIADAQLRVNKESLNRSIEQQRERLRNDRLQGKLAVFHEITSAYKSSEQLVSRQKQLSAEIEKDLLATKNKNTSTYKSQRFTKDWLDLSITPQDKIAEARARAEASLEESLKATAEQLGTYSNAYEELVHKLWCYHKQQKQPEKIESFFKAALAANRNETELATTKMLLRQYKAYKQSKN